MLVDDYKSTLESGEGDNPFSARPARPPVAEMADDLQAIATMQSQFKPIRRGKATFSARYLKADWSLRFWDGVFESIQRLTWTYRREVFNSSVTGTTTDNTLPIVIAAIERAAGHLSNHFLYAASRNLLDPECWAIFRRKWEYMKEMSDMFHAIHGTPSVIPWW